jgi:hypothetical protein
LWKRGFGGGFLAGFGRKWAERTDFEVPPAVAACARSGLPEAKLIVPTLLMLEIREILKSVVKS